MKKEPTERQQEIFEFIRKSIDRRGVPPTVREIGERFGMRSTNGVQGHLAALERSGLISREPGKSRSISLPSSGAQAVVVPLLGRVAAGMPVLAPENREGEVLVDPSLVPRGGSRELFALKVRGESMIDAHLLDGDTLLIRSQATARNGDIVVALVDGEATVKRFFQEKNRVRLQPENKAMRPIFVDRGELRILGKVAAVLRKV